MGGDPVPITLSINGKQERLEDGITIAALLAQRRIRPDVVTVEINRQIIEARRYGMTCLKEGDVIEMVYAIGGDRPCALQSQRVQLPSRR
jgi:thiamine biosynthesis protein ThiS